MDEALGIIIEIIEKQNEVINSMAEMIKDIKADVEKMKNHAVSNN